MSHGLMPSCASSTIRSLMALGRGLPLTNTPPSWFTSPKAGSASKRKHTRRTRRMAQKGASELLLIARQMSQLGDPQVTPRTLLYNSGMPPKLKGGRGRERQIGKGKKKKTKNKNEGGKKKKKKKRGKKERKSAATNVGALRTGHQTYSRKAHSRHEKRDRPNRQVSFIATGKKDHEEKKKRRKAFSKTWGRGRKEK